MLQVLFWGSGIITVILWILAFLYKLSLNSEGYMDEHETMAIILMVASTPFLVFCGICAYIIWCVPHVG